MRSNNNTNEQTSATFIETARRAQIIDCTVESLASLGYNQTNLAQIAKLAGIHKGSILYYFTSKDALLEQVVIHVVTKAAKRLAPQIEAQSTFRQKLNEYIHSAVAYIGDHRNEMIALYEITVNVRLPDGKLRYRRTITDPILKALERILKKGQENGEFRDFDCQVMAVTIRLAIDNLPLLLLADPELDVDLYARELVILFDRATRAGDPE